jgi:DNA topoisomerase I
MGTANAERTRRRLRAVVATTVADGRSDARLRDPAGLLYVNDDDPGISRRRRGRGFSYHAPDGARLTDRAALDRIRALAVPPAWTDAWICPSPRGHIQATGRDARGRKQYRYHALWRQVRDEAKYERSIAFGEALPRLRRRVERDLRSRGLERRKVVAAVVRLLDTTLMRVGNEEYARQNRSYGLTTLRDQHGRVRGSELRFSFKGKAGKRHEVSLRDRRLARIVRHCQELPGQRLFQYRDDEGNPQPIDSDDVNDYLRDALGDGFSARDFRTWAGTVLAYRCLRVADAGADKRRLSNAVTQVARWLGNTPAVCRSAYIHPAVLGAAIEAASNVPGQPENVLSAIVPKPPPRYGLSADEREVLAMLRRVERRQRRRPAA